MSKFILTESQYQKLVEQVDSNRAAMDLDIYSQPMTTDTDNGNLDVEDAVEDIIKENNLANLQDSPVLIAVS
jgi:hypothetical protein